MFRFQTERFFVKVLLSVLLLSIFENFATTGQQNREPASHQAVARRQDGVFFGLGGLDARLVPFDLDAFFEHAAPTRTTAKINRAVTSPSTKPLRQSTSSSSPRVTAASSTEPKLFRGFDGRDSNPSGRGTTFSRSTPQEVTVTSRSSRPDLIVREPTRPNDGRFSDDQEDRRGNLRAPQESSKVLFEDDVPPSQRRPIHRQTFRDFTVEDGRRGRNPFEPVDVDIKPTQHVPFRPSLTSSTSSRFEPTSEGVGSQRQFTSTEIPSRRPIDNLQRFRVSQEARPFAEIPRPRPILNFPSQPRRPPPAQTSTSFQNDAEDSRPNFSSRDQDSFIPHRSQNSVPIIDSSERSPSSISNEREQEKRFRSEPPQGAQFDFSSDNDDEVRRPSQPQHDLFDGPSQDPPAQEVDEDVSNQRNFRGELDDGGSQFFEPSSEGPDRIPHSIQEEEEDQSGINAEGPPHEFQSSDNFDDNSNDDRFVPSDEEDNSEFDSEFRGQSQSQSRPSPSSDASSRFPNNIVTDSINRHPSDDGEQPDIFQNPPRRQRPQSNLDFPQRQFSQSPDDENDNDHIFTRAPSHQNAGVTQQFLQDDVSEPPTGQLSASFVKPTEPTVFDTVESDIPTSDVRSRTPSKNTRRKVSGRRRVQRPKQELETSSVLLSQPQPASDFQEQQQQQQQQQQSSNRGTRLGTSVQEDQPSLLDLPPEVADFGQFPSRISSSAQGSSATNVIRPANNFQVTSNKRLPTTEAARSNSGRRFSNRGRPTAFSPRTTPSQFVTENTIDDVRLDAGHSRQRGNEQTFQDTRVSAVITPGQPATSCNPAACHLPKCFCGGNQLRPGNVRPEDTPQIILLTFDDAVNDLNWALYTRLFFKDRKNPNGCPILSTFYVSHEWTDYAKVQNLYAQGHEIASHSISHGDGRDYSKKKWYSEIYGQKEIMNVYGNVKLDDVKGMRSPFLAMGGDKQFSMLYETNFTYDTSMTVTDVHPPYWPYTLDYAIPHRCAIPPCPKLTYPGFWEIPMVALTDLNGGKCSMADGCSHATTEDGIYEMLMKNFERHYTSNRAPFGLYYHASWFLVKHRQEGFVKFLEDMLKRDDVYFVTALQMLEWMKTPTPLSKIKDFEPWSCGRLDRPSPCNRPRSCELRFKGDVRYMSTCHTCPNVYPWVGDTGISKSAHTISP